MNISKVIKITSDILFIAGLMIAGIFLFTKFSGRQFFSVYIVSSGSMTPAIQTGSVVFVSPNKSYGVGEIVTYKSGSKTTTTHRIVAKDGDKIKLAGDANNAPDPGIISADKIIGTVRFSMPYVGYIASFAKTPKGFILLVIVPATIIIYEEIKSLWSQIRLRIPVPRHIIHNSLFIIPIIFALLIPLTLSISYFIDRETSSGNQFIGSVPSPTPTSIPEPTATPTATPTLTPTPTPS